MLESVYAPVMIFLFARVHYQSAYHSEQTHFEQFPCITRKQYLVWVCMVCYMVKHATPQPTQVYATWCGRGGVQHAGMYLYSHIRICYALTLPLILLALFDPFHFSVCSEAEEAS